MYVSVVAYVCYLAMFAQVVQYNVVTVAAISSWHEVDSVYWCSKSPVKRHGFQRPQGFEASVLTQYGEVPCG